jgi:hypothetical protein
MTKEVKWMLGIAAVVGGYLLLKNGTALGLSFGADAPGVEPGDVTFARYQSAWDKAKKSGAPTFSLTGVRVFTEARERGWRFHYIYLFETPSGGRVSRTKTRVQ